LEGESDRRRKKETKGEGREKKGRKDGSNGEEEMNKLR
jgi:hypothetical protein